MSGAQWSTARASRSGTNEPNGNASRPEHASRTLSNLGISSKKNDFHNMDPDEIYANYTVHDVKTVLNKLRLDVDAKQEELRMMVGERYRDLLQASTSIIAMSEASIHVVSVVSEMKQTVNTDCQLITKETRTMQSADDSQLQILQSLAAHVKLLLDASEHLWRLLERKKFFQATWLFLLSRLVYRSILGEGTDDDAIQWEKYGINVKEQFPIAQRQWENLLPFRTQISHKATLSLRDLTMTPEEVCGTLLGLHLLDSLPLSDALDVFLKQRTRSLQLLVDSIQTSCQSITSGTSIDKTRRRVARQVWDALQSVLDAIVNTVVTARRIFQNSWGGEPPLIQRVLGAMQSEHGDQNMVTFPAELVLSTQTLLSSLPNSNNFFALPPDIRYFRPFVDLQSPSSSVSRSVLDGGLRIWFEKAINQLRDTTSSLLGRLEAIKGVWDVQTLATTWLSSPNRGIEETDTNILQSLVVDNCIKRIEEIWKSALKDISAVFVENVKSSFAAVAELSDDSRADVFPADFLLSAPPAPSITNVTFNAPHANASFDKFKHAINHRLAGATPLLEKTHSALEAMAAQLKSDSECVMVDPDYRHRLEGLFASSSDTVATELLSTLDTTLRNGENDTSPRHTRQIVFVGRLADKLISSSLPGDMRCSPQFQAEYASRASSLYEVCLKEWATRVVASEIDKLRIKKAQDPKFSPSTSESTPVGGPSPAIVDTLLSLVGAIQSLGAFGSSARKRAIALALFGEFVKSISAAVLEKPDAVAQDYYDLQLLKEMCNEWGADLVSSSERLETALKHVNKTLPELPQDVPASIRKYLPHLHLLLLPFIPLRKDAPELKSPTVPIGKHRSGSTSLEQGVQPILNLVKPSPRFGSLWVGASSS